jgi:nucleoside-diphosphate-sugar epimerase
MSKRAGELGAVERVGEVGGQTSLTILRLATVYGERDRGNVARLIGALERGRFVWPSSGNNRKSQIYREDAARACLAALEQPELGIRVFNVSAPPATMREIVAAICLALGRQEPRAGLPPGLLAAVSGLAQRLGDPGGLGRRLEKFVNDDVYNGSRFERAFKFSPAVSLTEGMRREVEFLRAQKRSPA